jgi:uncharacterized protein
MDDLRFQVTDLVGHPGLSREVAGRTRLHLKIGETTVDDVAEMVAQLDSIPEGILARGEASTIAHHQCSRCLIEWDAPVVVSFTELFARSSRPDLGKEDELMISHDGFVDLGPLVHDEISLALPPDPLCRADCAGLCPTCGADLNIDPCGGHGEDASSPFAALEQLFGSDT